MSTYKLGEICDIVSGSTPKTNNAEYWGGNQKWITPAEIKEDAYIVNDTERKLTELGVKSANLKFLPKGTVILSTRAPIGKVAIAGCEMYSNQGFKNLICNERINNKYLYWFLKSKKKYLNELGRGATFKELSKQIVASIEIDLPSIEIQSKRAEILKQLYDIRSNQEIQLLNLEELIKARFVEMFGTIENNKNEFEINSLNDICEFIKDGTHQTPTYMDDAVKGFKFLSSKDVTTGKIDWDHLKYIPTDLHEELYKHIAPKKGDILLAKNGTTGIAAIVDRDEIFDIYVSLAILRSNITNPVYLWAAINSDETKRQFNASLKGIGVPNLHLGEIKKAKIIVPPKELQNQFADFVKQVDKSKLAVQQSLEKTQQLFDSLMQEYFG